MGKLIINVDDLGLHSAVTQFMRQAIRCSAVTSASVLANGPSLQDVRDMNSNHELETVGLGAHLNILRGPPISPVGEVRSLLSTSGFFFGSFLELYYRLKTDQIRLAEVELEWSRQIELLLSLGLRITHLDSEQHTHCLPPLFPIATRLALRYGVRWVRRPMEVGCRSILTVGRLKAALLRNWINAAFDLPNGISSAPLVWGVVYQGPKFTSERLAFYLGRNRAASLIEVICHAGLPQPADMAIPVSHGSLRVPHHWQFEAKTILSEQWRSMIDGSGFTPVHFGMI